MSLSNLARTMLAIGALAATVASATAAETIDLTVGYSGIVRPAGEPATVIVGDDSIADVILVSGNVIVLTGKSIGSTNLIVLDGAGEVLLSSTVQVGPLVDPVLVDSPALVDGPALVDSAPKSMVRVARGVDVQVYDCEPLCNMMGSAGGGTIPAADPSPGEGQPESTP